MAQEFQEPPTDSSWTKAFSRDRGTAAVLLIVLLVSLILALRADATLGFGPDQIAYNLIAGELLTAGENNLPLQSEFGSVCGQAFSLLHACGQYWLGNATASYRLILFLSALAYLLAMYSLLVQVVDARSVALATAILSIVQRFTVGTSFWGMGEFRSILPRILVLAIFPIAWQLFEKRLRTRRVLDAFLVTAIGFTLHLSAVYFYCILLLTYGLWVLVSRNWNEIQNLAVATLLLPFAIRVVPSPAWSAALENAPFLAVLVLLGGFGLVWIFSRLPQFRWPFVLAVAYLASVYWIVAPSLSVLPQTSPRLANVSQINQALYARFGWSLFPISAATVGFAVFNGGIVAGLALWEYWQRRGTDERSKLVALNVLAVIIVSLGLTAALQVYCLLTDQPYMVLELFRAFRFIFLPLYIYLALFFRRQWQAARRGRHFGRQFALAILALSLLISPRETLAGLPDGIKLGIRSVAERSGSLNPADPSQKKYLEDLLATRSERVSMQTRHRDFLDLCRWVRSTTPPESLVMTTDYDFVHYADRDIMISYAQGAGSARSMAESRGHVAWHEAFVAVSGAFASRSPTRVMEVAQRFGVDYVVLPADHPPLNAETVYENRSYRLSRVVPADG